MEIVITLPANGRLSRSLESTVLPCQPTVLLPCPKTVRFPQPLSAIFSHPQKTNHVIISFYLSTSFWIAHDGADFFIAAKAKI